MSRWSRAQHVVLGVATVLLCSAAHGQAPPVQAVSQAAPTSGAAPRISMSALLQIDWIAHRQSSLDEVDPSTRAALNDDRFLLRRGRLRATLEQRHLAGWLELDANTISGMTVRPFEAVVAAGWPEALSAGRQDRGALGEIAPERREPDSARPSSTSAVSAFVGFMTIPFGFEAREPATARPWLERARFGQAFFGAARDLGIAAFGSYSFFRLAVALMNGEPLNTGPYSGGDLTASKDVVGRLGVVAPLGRVVHLEGGLSGLAGTGLSPGLSATKDSLVWIDDNENGLVEVVELSPAPGESATASKDFARYALGGDVRLRAQIPVLGALEIRGEIARGVNLDRAVEPADPIAAGRDLRELGWAVGVSQELFRYGQIAARWDYYDPDTDAVRQEVATPVPADRSYQTWSFSAAVRWHNARFVAEYDHEDNHLGRGASGEPTRLRDDRLTFRVEYAVR